MKKMTIGILQLSAEVTHYVVPAKEAAAYLQAKVTYIPSGHWRHDSGDFPSKYHSSCTHDCCRDDSKCLGREGDGLVNRWLEEIDEQEVRR